MSRLTDLLREAKKLDPKLGDALEEEVRHLQQRRAFGLNFERHTPEAVELYGRPVRVGDKVRMLPPRGQRVSSDKRLWIVTGRATVDGTKRADLREPKTGDVANHPIDDLVVVAEHTDVIYPGLVSTGKVERGGDKPFHTVINGENLHALKALLYTHTGKIDCVYIDPPYNTGAKDWKYNNDYVESDDLYRHSKWLAFMERRLRIARQLLNPTESVLIATIDEKECLRLGMLLEQVFPEGRIQMVTSVTNVRAVARSNEFSRTAEYVFFVMIGKGAPRAQDLRAEWAIGGGSKKTVRGKLHWQPLRRLGLTGAVKRSDRPNLFYPLYVKDDGTGIHSVGSPIPLGASPSHISPAGTTAVWPIRANGQDGYWQIGADKIGAFIEKGYVRAPRASTGSMALHNAGCRRGLNPPVSRRLRAM